ncbi:uncharacterized protein F4812DRAFT_414959 [Daldinia caldariorum]|uniref:uncharacterized protein n=1 Tax=Daldinia caldariorum TaxID=326644 RepID=UPI0020076BFB|nr:uncharacterized protein F4812DRAFT_414959 [Daldinia caldariorum]KAI1471642.1 hypothetical protein F4812DRAFT_414959 [Daldinia caldariorum]
MNDKARLKSSSSLPNQPTTLENNHDLGTLDHHPVLGLTEHSCIECNESFQTRGQLNVHAGQTMHYLFACSCGEKFSRLDARSRHISSFRKGSPSYPCKLCKRHRGRKAFHRRDHLVQHLRGYHLLDEGEIRKHYPTNVSRVPWSYLVLVCPFVGCEHHRGEEFRRLSISDQREQSPFKRISHYNKHLKDAHGKIPFPCYVHGCERVGTKGYLRQMDLKKHLATQHPDAPEYSPAPRRREQYNCPHCEHSFEDLFDLGIHYCNPPRSLNVIRRASVEGEASY